jgi:hypothetical protein
VAKSFLLAYSWLCLYLLLHCPTKPLLAAVVAVVEVVAVLVADAAMAMAEDAAMVMAMVAAIMAATCLAIVVIVMVQCSIALLRAICAAVPIKFGMLAHKGGLLPMVALAEL